MQNYNKKLIRKNYIIIFYYLSEKILFSKIFVNRNKNNNTRHDNRNNGDCVYLSVHKNITDQNYPKYGDEAELCFRKCTFCHNWKYVLRKGNKKGIDSHPHLLQRPIES